MEDTEIHSQYIECKQIMILVELLRVALFNKTYSLNINPEINKILKIAKQNMVIACISDVINMFSLSDEEKIYVEEEKNRVFRRQLLFDIEKDYLFSSLDEKNIPYIPIKGDIYSALYPKYGIREFSDCDVLINESDRFIVKEIFEKMGYIIVSKNGVNDVYNKVPILNFEIHNKLFSEDKFYYDYFSTINKRVSKKEEGKSYYIMTDEDVYLYTIAHLFKHSQGGLGFRNYIDFSLLYQKIHYTLNLNYISKILNEMGLLEFEQKLIRVAQNLFLEDKMTLSDNELVYIAHCGAYGTKENYIKNSIRNDKKIYIIKRLFPRYKELSNSYLILKKIPILYPLCIIFRFIKVIFSYKRLKMYIKEFKLYKRMKNEK